MEMFIEPGRGFNLKFCYMHINDVLRVNTVVSHPSFRPWPGCK